MASSWAAICCNVQSGDAVLMPTTRRTSRSAPPCGGARSSKLAATMPSAAAAPCAAVARPSRSCPAAGSTPARRRPRAGPGASAARSAAKCRAAPGQGRARFCRGCAAPCGWPAPNFLKKIRAIETVLRDRIRLTFWASQKCTHYVSNSGKAWYGLSALRHACRLRTEIRRFEAHYVEPAAGPPEIAVVLALQLTKNPEGRSVGNTLISVRAHAFQNNVNAIVIAFDSATGDALAQSVAWTVRAISMDRPHGSHP
jgi:hypothetical protein